METRTNVLSEEQSKIDLDLRKLNQIKNNLLQQRETQHHNIENQKHILKVQKKHLMQQKYEIEQNRINTAANAFCLYHYLPLSVSVLTTRLFYGLQPLESAASQMDILGAKLNQCQHDIEQIEKFEAELNIKSYELNNKLMHVIDETYKLQLRKLTEVNETFKSHTPDLKPTNQYSPKFFPAKNNLQTEHLEDITLNLADSPSFKLTKNLS